MGSHMGLLDNYYKDIATFLAIASIAQSVDAGEKQRAGQSKSLRTQKESQRQGLARSVAQERLAGQADAKANKKKPNVNSLLFSERDGASQGAGSTMLSGGGGGTPLMGHKSGGKPLLGG